MYISVECELPTIELNSTNPVKHSVFQRLWHELKAEGWNKNQFGVSRSISEKPKPCILPDQVITTDTGPTLEIIPSPSLSILEVDSQLADLRQLVVQKLARHGFGLLGSGIHPYLRSAQPDYYTCRTPRINYDYAIKERDWHHWTVLGIAATQEVIDIPFDQAIRVIRVMNRLAGLFIFLCRNDPNYDPLPVNHQLSTRPLAWRKHIPANSRFPCDRHKVWLPVDKEIQSWADYIRLLWMTNPMFPLGTKSGDCVFVPEHPTFWKYLRCPPSRGWPAQSISNGSRYCVQPDISQVAQTDWTYMGFARLRWQWKDNTEISVDDLITAIEHDHVDRFLADNLTKVLLENRSIATPPPGEELASLALICGLVLNLDETEALAFSQPYQFWLSVAKASEIQLFDSTVDGQSITDLISHLLKIAQTGLQQRNEDHYLAPLWRRLTRRQSPSEDNLFTLQKTGSIQQTMKQLLYKT